MKKYLVVCFTVVAIGCLTGCGNSDKTLKCSKESTQTGMDITQSVEVSFNGSDVAKMKIEQKIDVDDSYSAYMEELESAFESEFSSFNDQKGISVNSSAKDNVITVTLDANFAEMDDETKQNLSIVDTTANYSDMKKAFEDEGYSCK